MVGTAHINLLLSAALEDVSHTPMYWGAWDDINRFQVDFTTADQVGALLLNENQLSVNERYDEEELEPIYTFTSVPRSHVQDCVLVLKAIACYECQSCEHAGWNSSNAKQFCEDLRQRMVCRLPGWDEAPGWVYTNENKENKP